MTDDWSLKDKRLLFRALKEWGCDADCGLYPFDEDKKELILTDDEKEYADNECIKLSDWDISDLIHKYKWYYYSAEDIEFLKQKLIEDLIELDNKTHDREYNWLADSLKIINKRFSVEE